MGRTAATFWWGGAGADKLYGSAGHDLIVGDNGRLLTVDFLSFGNVASMESTDTTDVNGGVDTITGDDGDDLIHRRTAG